jgi:hypothetical protein
MQAERRFQSSKDQPFEAGFDVPSTPKIFYRFYLIAPPMMD